MSCIAYFKERVNGKLHIIADSSTSSGGFALSSESPKLFSLLDNKARSYVTVASVGSAKQQNVIETVLLTPSVQNEIAPEAVDELFCQKDYKQRLKHLVINIIEVYNEVLNDNDIEMEQRGELFIAIKGEIFMVDSHLAVIAPLFPFYATGAPGDIVQGALETMLRACKEEPTGQRVKVLLNEAFAIGRKFFPSSILDPLIHVEQEGKPHVPLLKVVPQM